MKEKLKFNLKKYKIKNKKNNISESIIPAMFRKVLNHTRHPCS